MRPRIRLFGEAATYYLPPPLATSSARSPFHLAGLLALFIIGMRLTGQPDVGWALVALYCGSGFVLGIGGEEEFIGGMTFVSHIAPAAATLVAFACLPLPGLAGALLAVSVGAGFYPAFMLPAWAGYFWRDRPRLIPLSGGLCCRGRPSLAAPRWRCRGPPMDGGLSARSSTTRSATTTDPQGYGRSPFGFWGQREGLRRWLMTPAGRRHLVWRRRSTWCFTRWWAHVPCWLAAPRRPVGPADGVHRDHGNARKGPADRLVCRLGVSVPVDRDLRKRTRANAPEPIRQRRWTRRSSP
jgi:hypothetical protein